jgi:hypothetical protein
MIEIVYSFCLGVCAGLVGTNIYETIKIKRFWHKATLGLTDFDIKCINDEYARRKKAEE